MKDTENSATERDSKAVRSCFYFETIGYGKWQTVHRITE